MLLPPAGSPLPPLPPFMHPLPSLPTSRARRSAARGAAGHGAQHHHRRDAARPPGAGGRRTRWGGRSGAGRGGGTPGRSPYATPAVTCPRGYRLASWSPIATSPCAQPPHDSVITSFARPPASCRHRTPGGCATAWGTRPCRWVCWGRDGGCAGGPGQLVRRVCCIHGL